MANQADGRRFLLHNRQTAAEKVSNFLLFAGLRVKANPQCDMNIGHDKSPL